MLVSTKHSTTFIEDINEVLVHREQKSTKRNIQKGYFPNASYGIYYETSCPIYSIQKMFCSE